MEETENNLIEKKPKKKRIALKIIGVIFIIFLVVSVAGYYGYKSKFNKNVKETIEQEYGQSVTEVKGTDPDIKNPLTSVNPRRSFLNSTGDEVAYIDHAGNLEGIGNITTTTTATGGYGFFAYLGSAASRITKGWFTSIDTININASDWTNVSVTESQVSDLGSYLLDTGDTATGSYTFDSPTFHIDSSGNMIGIGTTSPGNAKLHIFSATEGAEQGLTLYNGTGSTFRIWRQNDIAYLTRTATATQGIAIASGGEVGIGITSPTAKLDVYSNAASEYIAKFFQDHATGYGVWIDTDNTGTDAILRLDSGIGVNVFRVQADGEVNILGNVGIGTASPSTLLDLYTNGADLEIRMEEDAGTHDVRTHYRRGGVDWYTGLIGSANFQIVYSLGEGGELEPFTILESGNVGIGTTSPGAKLEVEDSAFPTMRIESNTADATSGIRFKDYHDLVDSSHDVHADIVLDGTGNNIGKLYFKIPHTDTRMTIQSDGNVGIGIASPGNALHIYKDLDAPSDLGNFAEYQLIIQTGATTGDTSGILLSSSIDTYGGSAIVHYDTDAGGKGDLVFYTKQGTAAIPPVEVMRLDDAGNVGIGINPLARLHVYGATEILRLAEDSADGSPYLSFYQTTTRRSYIQHKDVDNMFKFDSEFGGIEFNVGSQHDALVIDIDGKVGIGTASPNTELEVSKATQGAVLRLSNTDGAMAVGEYAGKIDFYKTDASTGGAGVVSSIRSVATDSGGSFGLGFSVGSVTTPKTDALFIRYSGDVGIGDITPSYDLDVTANIGNTGDFYLGDTMYHRGDTDTYFDFGTDTINIATAGSSRIFIEAGGDIGIGTASPEVKLEVIGSLNVGNFANNAVGNLQVKGDGANAGITIWNEATASTFRLWVNDSANFAHITRGATATAGITIDSTGQVGIKDASPSYELDVAGTIRGTNYRSGDGTLGMTASCDGTATVKDGLVISCTGSGTFYWTCDGNAFDATEPNTDDVYKSPIIGVIIIQANAIDITASVSLPNGAVITGAETFGNIADETWTLSRVALATGTASIMATANINTEDTSITTATVDNSVYAYYIYTSTLDSADRIYGAKITYTT